MTEFKALCGIVAGVALGYVVGAWITGLNDPRSVAIAIAVAGAGWLGVECCKWVERDYERIRAGRQQVWFRRECARIQADFDCTKDAMQDQMFGGLTPLIDDFAGKWPEEKEHR